jgi:hypothetical protein
MLVFFMFPHKQREEELLEEYHTLDSHIPADLASV